MRITLLNHYYPPDTSATAAVVHDVVEALARSHQVTVVAGRPSYAPLETHPYYLLRREAFGNVNVERVGSTAFQRRRTLGRIINYMSYLVLALLRTLMARPTPDVVIAMTDPPVVSLVGALVAKVRGATFVYNVRDLHPDMALAAGVVRPGYFVALWSRLHRWALRRASLVISLGDDMRERLIAKGVDPARIVVVRDGARPMNSVSADGHPVTREIRAGFDFVVLHAGNLGFAGLWDTLLEAAGTLADQGVGFVFIGDGAQRDSLERRALGLSNVRFLPFYPQEDLPHVLASADLHIVTVRQGLEGLVVPSKLYPILMAGRPVLAVAPAKSDVVRIVERYGCGMVADPDDAGQVARLVHEAKSSPQKLSDMGERAKGASSAFDRETELTRFVQLVEQAGAAP